MIAGLSIKPFESICKQVAGIFVCGLFFADWNAIAWSGEVSDVPGEDPALMGHWPLDDAKGKVAVDRSSLHNNGALENISWTQGGTGWAPAFNGVNSHIKVPHQPCFNLQTSLTIESWIWLDSVSGDQSFVSKGRGEWGSGYTFFQRNGKLGLGLNTTVKPGENRKGSGFSLETGPILKERTWMFVAATYDEHEQAARLFVDGQMALEAKVSGKITYLPPSDYPYDTVPLTFSGIATYPALAGQVNGFMREIRIYSRALAGDEIRRDYQKTIQIKELKLISSREILDKAATCVLKMDVCDKDTGEPLASRIYIKDCENRFYLPGNCFSYGSEKMGYFYLFDEKGEIKLPPGEFEFSIFRGFEYEPGNGKFSFKKDGERQCLKVGLKRLVDFASKGWLGGEHHIQYIGHGCHKYDNTLGLLNASRICAAEGMNYASFVQGLEIDASGVCSKSFIARGNLELCPNLGGHLCCVNIREKPRNQAGSFGNLQMIDGVFSQGGLAIYTHPTSGMGDVGDNTRSREMPVAVALGKMPVWDVSYGALRSFDHQLVKDWYRYLNLGFKLAAGGSTDAYLNNPSVMCPPGASRTYVKTGDLSWASIVDAYRQGRTFISNGPLLIFQIQGKDPGETVILNGKASGGTPVHVEGRHLFGLERMEIIQNGRVIKTIACHGSKTFKDDFTIDIHETGWLAARCLGMKSPFLGCLAHSSPVYVQCGTEKIKASHEDAEYFVNWLEEYKRFIPKYCDYRRENIAKARELFARIEEAIGKYRSLAADEKH
ncbi:MAG: CehA/McbA family metallohydrolase [Verrucomicrobiae bacterium]|nr:CehA/McbA family metallohydrolase [Verrucomicrobiae bacterium]